MSRRFSRRPPFAPVSPAQPDGLRHNNNVRSPAATAVPGTEPRATRRHNAQQVPSTWASVTSPSAATSSRATAASASRATTTVTSPAAGRRAGQQHRRNGDILSSHSPVIVGTGNHATDSSQTAGSHIIRATPARWSTTSTPVARQRRRRSAGGSLVSGGPPTAATTAAVATSSSTAAALTSSTRVGGNRPRSAGDLGSGNNSVIGDSSRSSAVNFSLNSSSTAKPEQQNTANTSIGSGNLTPTSAAEHRHRSDRGQLRPQHGRRQLGARR